MKEISLDTACALHIGPRESLVRIAEATARGGKNSAGALRDRIQGKAGDAFCCMQIDEWKLLSESNFEHSEADCESLMIIPSRHECTYSFSPLGTTAFTSGSVHEWDGVWEDTTLPSWLCVLIEGHYVTQSAVIGLKSGERLSFWDMHGNLSTDRKSRKKNKRKRKRRISVKANSRGLHSPNGCGSWLLFCFSTSVLSAMGKFYSTVLLETIENRAAIIGR